MKMWQNLSIQWKLAIPIGVISVLLIMLTINKVSTMRAITSDFNSIQENYFPALDMTLNADRDLYQAQIAERTIAMGGYDAAVFKSFEENVEQVADRLNRVKELDIHEPVKGLVNEFLSSFRRWESNSRSMIENVKSNGMSTADAARLSKGGLADQFEASRDVLDKIGENLSATSTELANTVNEHSQSSIQMSLILNGIVILIAVAVAIFLPRAIIKAISRLQQALSEIASGKGDLTARVESMGNDELGTISNTFNTFLTSMETLVVSITQSAKGVSHSSSTLDHTMYENAQSIDELASSIEVVASALTEMAAAITEVSSNTQEVSSETNHADREAQNVAKIFKGAIQDIGALSDHVDVSVEAIKRLEGEASAIASVVDVIQGIAEQTNLLALNAAIEAARAGDQGRGFAVVADEVRTLASKTQESTEHINNMINKLQSGVNDVVSAMDTVKQNAASTVDTAINAESSLNDVAHNLTTISGRAIQVAAAVEEQSSVVEDITKHIDMINAHACELSQRAETIGSASAELKQESTALMEQVGNFKVS
ncbi:MAG: methyl-accepting chemotaxis protein [Pseudomonadota bacterium]|nr:methyl-accepting chemotaxis protein [Pseudomonadota bacterium]